MSTLTEKSQGRMLVPVKWALKRCNKAIKARQFPAVIEQLWNSVPFQCAKTLKFLSQLKTIIKKLLDINFSGYSCYKGHSIRPTD